MTQKLVFVNRRRGVDRRFEKDPGKELPVDPHHQKRRKSTERRDTTRSLIDDYYAYMQKTIESVQARFRRKKPNKPSKN